MNELPVDIICRQDATLEKKEFTACFGLIQQKARLIVKEDADKVRTIDDNQLFEWFASWRSEGLVPLVTIKGYTELLLKGASGELTDEQRRFVEIIFHNCDRAADWFRLPATYLTLRLGKHRMHWEKVHLPDLIAQALSGVQVDHIEVDLPDGLPPIRGNQWLQTAIWYLVEPDLSLARNDACPTRIKADLVGASSVLIQICTGVQLDLAKDGEPFFFPGTRLSIADQVIRLLDSQIQTRALDKGTEFQFALPVWQMPPDTPPSVELTTDNDGDQLDLMQGQDLVVHLASAASDSLPWRITDLDPQILAYTGASWKSEEGDLELRFGTFKVGHTPLRIEYDRVGLPKTAVFSVQIKVGPQTG